MLLLFVLELRKALEEMSEETVEVTPAPEITRQVTNSRQENENEGEVADDAMNTSSQVLATDDLELARNSTQAVTQDFHRVTDEGGGGEACTKP